MTTTWARNPLASIACLVIASGVVAAVLSAAGAR